MTVVDEQHNAVFYINSMLIPGAMGRLLPITGITPQNRGVCFVLEEDHTNCVGPGKRPMHTIIRAMGYAGIWSVFSFGVMGVTDSPSITGT